MADKNNLQKVEKTIFTIETRLSSFEQGQTTTQEHITLLKADLDTLAQDNAEVKRGIPELTDLVRNELLQKAKVTNPDSSQSSQSHHILTPVSHSPHTPTHFATVNDSNTLEKSKSKSINWEGFTQPAHTHPFKLNARFVDPSTLHEFQHLNPKTHSDLDNQIIPPQYLYSSLNPYAPPLYPHLLTNPNFTNQTSFAYHPPYSIHQPPSSTVLQTHSITQPTTTTIYTNTSGSHPHTRTISARPAYKTPKLDFSHFDGKDPRGWTSKCEKFFQLHNTTDPRSRVLCAALHMDGEADIWYRCVEREKHNLLWPEFLTMVCHRFAKNGYENLVGQFNKLVQKGRVDEYICQFDELRNYVMVDEGFHRESYYVDNFISGLNEEIAQHLYNLKTRTLHEARELARGQEYYLDVLDKRYKSLSSSHKISSYTPQSKTTATSTKPNLNTLANSTKPLIENSRRLTLAEITDRKQKGLCFHCDQKFEPGHNCRKKNLYIIMNAENTSPAQDTKELALIWEDDNPTGETTETEATSKISLHAITGSKGSGTLKVQGFLLGRKINILLDSGSSNNFIS